ncbi:uncharacterized protein KY384_002207 [Bacidia gigantensis]|uniref:uncharacterized protein n=1 Tax=Bacidia gigantensis TaxID=2732470 RepID=UPI001D046D03|nr:uncharacterized protein KY384_002207 [Bacidia gigantensis]KAG8533424.1 hypothetical protein KY384_002207 [Bacidia gigantensis]
MAYANYNCPRPRPIDPAIFFDMVKIRQLIDDATDLSIRAANGTASGGSHNSDSGLYGSAAALGFGGIGGTNIKLSRERKHRMRDLATRKLSQAYYLEEIAASVATMQGTSSLEDVANLVLQRNPEDSHAKYVHFFHEKIPSRMLAQCTSLQALDEVIEDQPLEAAPLRTRAVTKLFMEEYQSALEDLTAALRIYRNVAPLHGWKTRPAEHSTVVGHVQGRRRQDPDRAAIKKDVERLSSLEPQLLFHRGGVYLTLACQRIHVALDTPLQNNTNGTHGGNGERLQTELDERQIEAQRSVKINAKRALKDYLEFLSHLEYTALSTVDSFDSLSGQHKTRSSHESAAISADGGLGEESETQLSSVRDPSTFKYRDQSDVQLSARPDLNPHQPQSTFRQSKVYSASELFSISLPADIPPYPSTEKAPVTRKAAAQQVKEDMFRPPIEDEELLTYHPLVVEVLHAVLLCHSLIQTPPKQILRHAHMVARLARICEGYPIFLTARSPSRSDWIQILQKTANWIDLGQSWENLCSPPPLPNQNGAVSHQKTPEEMREQRRHEAILEALADERVHDEASFQAAMRANTQESETSNQNPTFHSESEDDRWSQQYAKEHPSGSGRAEAVARWVREAPQVSVGGARSKRGTKGKIQKCSMKQSSSRTSQCSEQPAIESLTVTDEPTLCTDKSKA